MSKRYKLAWARDFMERLVAQVNELMNSEVRKMVEARLDEFSSFRSKSDEEWFSELCFCILAANSKQKTAEAIQKGLGYEGLISLGQEELSKFIRDNKHRFHNNKAKYIIEARKYLGLKKMLLNMGEVEARAWLAESIKGIGYKEASHFLRNVGYQNLAILDRHILGILEEHGIIERPKTLTKKSYLDIEEKFKELAAAAGMTSAKLDLCMWYIKNGEIAK